MEEYGCSHLLYWLCSQGAVALAVGSVPRRIVPKLRHFRRLLKTNARWKRRSLGKILRGADPDVSATAPRYVQSSCRLTTCVCVLQPKSLFSVRTKSIVWGMQSRAVQGMLDFDYACSRAQPSVVAIIYPFVWVQLRRTHRPRIVQLHLAYILGSRYGSPALSALANFADNSLKKNFKFSPIFAYFIKIHAEIVSL